MLVKKFVNGSVTGAPTIYTITFQGDFTTGVAGTSLPLVVAGGFDLDFGQSLGDLAGIKTTGSVIPLAGLFAKAGFGIDLSPSQSLEISPAVFSPGPRVDVVSVQEGGKAISVRTIRDGNGSGLNEIQEVTARGTAASTFTLSYNNSPTAPIAVNATDDDIKDALTDASIPWLLVSTMDRPQGRVIRITFAASAGNASQLVPDGGALVARDEVQDITVANANGGTFKLSFSYDVNANGTIGAGESGATAANQFNVTSAALKTAIETAVSGIGAVTVAPVATTTLTRRYRVTFGGAGATGKDVPLLGADASDLTGALDNGKLVDDVHFNVSVFNGAAIAVSTTAEGVASITVSTQDEGGKGIGDPHRPRGWRRASTSSRKCSSAAAAARSR